MLKRISPAAAATNICDEHIDLLVFSDHSFFRLPGFVGVFDDIYDCAANWSSVAETIGWPVVAIDADMQITLGGRQYRLLSESEQWRTDTVLAIAISHTAGIDFVVLDRFDVLDNTGRAQAIDGLDVLAEQQIIESALVMGTVKNKPDLDAFDQSAVFWIEAGEIVAEKSDVRKAA
ncbi:hypothetical protein ACVFVO_12715 [Advenella kashmirensis]